ncbi:MULTISPECIES: hypothetical protein [Paenibacillus]|uniref:Uncharacterized protein n=1 Tax=Paenibacillus naphthalenovorans TaxID=162209 RepID=A0A0U2KZZ5_9BACL|nr:MULTISPECIES: hypothetical protein [Paenibacillus]ALS22706.1 hypothetical protein IJ22_23330 [Paenibacillus naphthalenovorans]GCL70501.1 hypothetical protein PN4B1_04030 [Paenibacillus naphthalenovorans]
MKPKNHNETTGRYEDLFLLFAQRVEKALIVMLVILMMALAVSQLLLQHPQIRHLLVKVEQLEGNPYPSASSPAINRIRH